MKVVKAGMLGLVIASTMGCIQKGPEQVAGESKFAYRIIENGTFQSFVKNWDDHANPVLFALIRNTTEWNAVFHPAPVMGSNRPFSPEASSYEEEQILVIAKVAQSTARLIVEEVVFSEDNVLVRYHFEDKESDKSYTVKKHVCIAIPAGIYKRIVFEENGSQMGALYPENSCDN